LQEMQTKELEANFSKLSVRNTNKKLRRKDNKIAELKEVNECRSIENRLKQTELVAEKRKANLVYAKKKSESIAKEMEQLKAQTRQLDKVVTELHAELDCVQDEREFLQRIAELESCTFETKEHKQKYLDNMRQCCIELLSMNVGIKNIEPIIRRKHVTGMMVAELPHSTTLVQMLAEMKALSCQQLAEELGTSDNLRCTVMELQNLGSITILIKFLRLAAHTPWACQRHLLDLQTRCYILSNRYYLT